MKNFIALAICLVLPIATSSLGCQNAFTRAVAKRESYCSSLPSNICGNKCKCSDDPYIQDGYYCDCRSCKLKSDCKEIFNAGNTVSGIYRIAPQGILMDVFCEMNATASGTEAWKRGGWIVIQRRVV